MPAFALSPAIETQLAALAVKVRRLRILRGASWFVVAVIAAPLFAVALDATFELSVLARGGLLAAWLASAVCAAYWFVVRRYRGVISPAELARILEVEFPSLAGRLQTLGDRADAKIGSRTMIALLAGETERCNGKLDFHRIAPAASSFRLAGLAAIIAIAPLVFFFGSGDRIVRLLVPWHTATADPQYEIIVSSGDPVVERGRSITVSGYLKKTQPNASLPDSATVVFRPVGSIDETKMPMVGDENSAFTLTRPNVVTDLDYRIECGATLSEWHCIRAVDPVEVAAGGEVAIIAPAYAVARRPRRILPALADIEALQYSRAELKVNLNRPARAVQLEWWPLGAKAGTPVERLAVTLDESRSSAMAVLPLRVDGTLKWIFFADRDVRTEILQSVRVLPDAPPRFERVLGFPLQPHDVRPGEELQIDLAASDDTVITRAVLEYGPVEDVAESQLTEVPVAIAGLGSSRIEGPVTFKLPAGAEGQTYRVRLRIRDDRSLPEFGLNPQTATYPEKGWAVLRISATARPLVEQEAVARADRTRANFAALRKWTAKAHGELKLHRHDFQGLAKLEPDHSIRIADGLDAVREALGPLEELVSEPAPSGFRAVGALARELSGDIRTAEVELKRVLTEAEAAPRDTAALAAQRALEAALLKLAALESAGETALAEWLDLTRLKRLAREQERLADGAMNAKSRTELAAKQRELAGELDDLLRASDALKRGAADARALRNERESEELRRIARDQRELDAAIRRGESEANRDRIELLTEQQKELAGKIKKLGEQTDLPSRLAQTAPLDQKPVRAAADLLEKQKPIEALTEQEKAARDLERLADALEKSATDRADARKAAQQLARWQEDLQRRATEGSKQTPRGDSPADREKWAGEQLAIRDETRRLPLPPSPALDKALLLAVDTTAAAVEQLKRDPVQAAEIVRKATDALNQLAEKIPGQTLRLQAAALELDAIRKGVDAVVQETDEIVRLAKNQGDLDARKKLESLAEKQEGLSKAIRKIDAPGRELRRERAVDACERARDNLKNGRLLEAAVSLREAKLRLDRLKQSLAGQTPADDRAAELARLQNELVENLSKSEKLSPDELQRLRRSQGDIARHLQQLLAPEAQSGLQGAREAALAAEAALKKAEPDVDELKKKCALALLATRELERKLNPDGRAAEPPRVEDSPNLPNQKDADDARALAREQRELRDRLSRIAEASTKPPTPSRGDPLKAFVRKQEKLAGEIERFAREAKAAGRTDFAAKAEQAAKRAREAGRNLDVGDASGAGVEAAGAKKDLESAATASGNTELAERVIELGRQQNQWIAETAKRVSEPGSELARQREKQRELAEESRGLALKFSSEVADSLKRAAEAMDQSHRNAVANKPGEAAKSRQLADDALSRAQKSVGKPTAVPTLGALAQSIRDAAIEAEGARESMEQAERELGRSRGSGAAPAMRRAAEQLKRAAEKFGDSHGPSTERGELPGDGKSESIRELRVKYGENYARLIQLYFEQLAERR